MTPLEQSMEEDRKAISAPVAEKQGVEKIIQDAANSPAPEPEPEPEDNDDEDDLEAGTKEDNEPQDKAKPESHAKARITAREEREARIKAEIRPLLDLTCNCLLNSNHSMTLVIIQ